MAVAHATQRTKQISVFKTIIETLNIMSWNEH